MTEGREPTGSVADEAVKLLRALKGWSAESGKEHVDVAGSAAGGLAASLHEVNEHLATGGEDCKYCPLCQAISAVRGTPPEVRAHLVTAATSFLKAIEGVMATSVPDTSAGKPPASPAEDDTDVSHGGDRRDD